MKDIGTIKEVYLNEAKKTKNGLTKKDIINLKKKSKKNNFNNPLIRYRQHSKKKPQINTNRIDNFETERKHARLERRKKSIRKKKNKNNKLSNKITFNMNNNIIKEYYCKELDGYQSDDELNYSNEFKIEEIPEIDISNYF